MKSINKEAELPEEEFPSPPLKRRSIKDVVSVCPICFYPTKIHAAVFGSMGYSCTNKECQWSGTISIEVSIDEYQEFMEERKKKEKLG